MKVEWRIKHTMDHATFATTAEAELTIDGTPIEFVSDAVLEEAKAYYFDKWNWETNNPDDRAIFETLDQEWRDRKEGKKTRRLRARWTVEAQQDLMNFHGIDIEQEIVEQLEREIADEILRDL